MNKKNKLFIYGILILLFLPGIFLLTKINIGEKQLQGTQIKVERPQFTFDNFKAGKFQPNFEKYLNQELPLRPTFVRLNNQFYYSFFSKSYMQDSNLVIGVNNNIYEKGYLDNYFMGKIDEKQMDSLINRLVSAQKIFSKYNKTMIFLVTPNKAEIYPEYAPKQYQQYGENNDEDENYITFVKKLQVTDLNFIDSVQITKNLKEQSDLPVFPIGGTHWNTWAATETVNKIIENVNNKRKLNLPVLHIEKTIINTIPDGADGDLYNLLNIMRKPKFLCIHPVWEKKEFVGDKVPTAIITGSFGGMILDVLKNNANASGSILGPIDYSFYYKVVQLHVEKGKQQTVEKQFPQMSKEEWKHSILANDVVIIELNSALPFGHVNAFLDDVEKYL